MPRPLLPLSGAVRTRPRPFTRVAPTVAPGSHRSVLARGQADPERRAGHGPSTGSGAAAIAQPVRWPAVHSDRHGLRLGRRELSGFHEHFTLIELFGPDLLQIHPREATDRRSPANPRSWSALAHAAGRSECR